MPLLEDYAESIVVGAVSYALQQMHLNPQHVRYFQTGFNQAITYIRLHSELFIGRYTYNYDSDEWGINKVKCATLLSRSNSDDQRVAGVHISKWPNDITWGNAVKIAKLEIIGSKYIKVTPFQHMEIGIIHRIARHTICHELDTESDDNLASKVFSPLLVNNSMFTDITNLEQRPETSVVHRILEELNNV